MNRNSRIYVAGHNGMVGSAVLRLLMARGYNNLLLAGRDGLDLRNQEKVSAFMAGCRPEYVFFCAGRVAGIKANSERPADFLYDNMMMAANAIHQSYMYGVKKLCFLGSSCIYPRRCPQPMKEADLLTGELEPTNEGYAMAKLAGYKMAYYYSVQHGMATISVMPCNLYGRNDHFDLDRAHVLSALVKRFVDAEKWKLPSVTLWGTGSARREFLNVDDLADALLFLMDRSDDPGIINVGTGTDLAIRDLAAKIALAAGYRGDIGWDATMPDGMARKCMDVGRITNMGWQPRIALEDGIARLVEEYRRSVA